jgi:hypothetical protein
MKTETSRSPVRIPFRLARTAQNYPITYLYFRVAASNTTSSGGAYDIVDYLTERLMG